MSTEREQWHLSKSVPISLIAAVMLQTAVAFWWASKITQQADDLIRRVEATERRQNDLGALIQEVRESLAEIKGALGIGRRSAPQRQE